MVIKWALTNRCNLKCKYCYNADLRKENEEITLKRAKELLYDLKENHVTNIQFLGGEPLLWNGIEELILCCKKLGIDTWITTNGTLCNASFLETLMKNGLNKIIFSIDGPNPRINDKIRGRNSFKKAINALTICSQNSAKYNTEIAINTVLGKEALFEIEQYYDFINKYVIDEITFGIPDIMGAAKNHIELIGSVSDVVEAFNKFAANYTKRCTMKNVYLSLPPLICKCLDEFYNTSFYKKRLNYCMGGSSVFFIDADGLLYPCNIPAGMLYFKQTRDLSLQENNVKSKFFSDLYWKREYLEFFQHARENDTNIFGGYEKKFCQCCSFAKNKICGNSCPVHVSEKRNCLLCEEFCRKFNVNHKEIIV